MRSPLPKLMLSAGWLAILAPLLLLPSLAGETPESPAPVPPAAGRAPSLLFSTDDVDLIERALSLRNQGTAAPPVTASLPVVQDPERLNLGGIIYFDSSHWAFWLNGRQVVPGRLPKQVKQVQVNQDRVTLVWERAADGHKIPMTLRAGESAEIPAAASAALREEPPIPPLIAPGPPAVPGMRPSGAVPPPVLHAPQQPILR